MVEQEILLEVPDLRKAIVAMYASFYAFNIAYPKEAKNTFLFIERPFSGIPSEKLSHTLLSCISSIQKLLRCIDFCCFSS